MRFISATLIIFQLLILIFIARYSEIANDVFWHLRIGLDFIEKGLNPLIDHYTILYFGQPYKFLMPTPFQVILASFHKAFGLVWGLVFFKLSVFIATLLMAFFLFKRHGVSFLLQLLAFTLMTSVFVHRSFPRPETLSYLMCILLVWLIERARVQFSLKNLSALVVFQWAWVNIHYSSIVGYVVLFTFCAEQMIYMWEQKSFAKLKEIILFGLIALGVGFLNPLFNHPILTTFQFSEKWTRLISEFQPQSLVTEFHLLVLFLSALSLYLFAATRRWGGGLFILLLGWKALEVNKVFSLYFMLLIPLMILALHEYVQARQRQLHFKELARIKWTVLVLMGLLVVWQVSYFVLRFQYAQGIDFLSLQKPVEVAQYIKKSGITKGNVFNSYNDGGYLIYSLPPGMKIYIDGRTNLLYTPEEMERAVSAQFFPVKMFEEINKYNIDYLVGPLNRPDLSVETALRAGLLGLEYAGKNFALLSQREINYVMGRKLLIQPDCLKDGDLVQLEKELRLAQPTHEPNDLLLRLLTVSRDYLRAKDKERFVENLYVPRDYLLYDVRLFAILNQRHKEWERALSGYGSLAEEQYTLRDQLLILNFLTYKKDADSQKYTDYMLGKILRYRDSLSNRELAIFYNLLKKFEKKGGSALDLKEISDKLYAKNKASIDLYKSVDPKDVFKYKCDESSELIVK